MREREKGHLAVDLRERLRGPECGGGDGERDGVDTGTKAERETETDTKRDMEKETRRGDGDA